MSNQYIWTSIIVMALVSYGIRVIPLTLLRKPIQSKWIRSFLYYVPYVTLAIMTFPAMMYATGSRIAGLCAFAAGIIITWFGGSLFQTSILCCVIVYIIQLFI